MYKYLKKSTIYICT